MLLLLLLSPLFFLFAGKQNSICYLRQYDIGMCAYNCLLRVVARFHDEIFSDPDSPSGLNEVNGIFPPCHPNPSIPRIEKKTLIDPARLEPRFPCGNNTA